MATEHTTERTDGATTERTTVVSDNGTAPARSGGNGAMGLVGIVAVLALVAIVAWFLLNANRQEAAQTDAISDAASSVADSAGNAAEAVGDAARNVTPPQQ